MTKNNYAVTVKFGHVGRNNYIIKTIPIRAENGREAAEIARWTSRVKHHAKDAILSVIKIDDDQFEQLRQNRKNDAFFHCTNIQEQRAKCSNYEKEIHRDQEEDDFDDRKQKRKERIAFGKMRKKEFFRECLYTMRNYTEAFTY